MITHLDASQEQEASFKSLLNYGHLSCTNRGGGGLGVSLIVGYVGQRSAHPLKAL